MNEEFSIIMPFTNFNSVFNILETMFNKLSENEYIQGEGNQIEYHVYYEFDNDDDDDGGEEVEGEGEEKSCFKNCKEINSQLCKFEKIKDNDELLKSNECCNICCANYTIGEYKRTIPNCKHVFHKKCIDKWLKKNSTCPMCRDNLIK